MMLVPRILVALLALSATTVGWGRELPKKPPRASVQIHSVQGSVYVRRSGESEWIPVKGPMQVPYDSFLNIKENAKVVVMGQELGKDPSKVPQTQITISEPNLLRLDSDLFRLQDREKKLFVHKFPDQQATSDTADQAPDGVWDDLKERFAVVAHFFEGDDRKVPEMAAGVSSGRKHQKINIFTPDHKEMIEVSQYPHALRVMWQDIPRPDARYLIYLWPIEKAQPKPYAQTLETKIEVMIHQRGDYYIQIATDDHAFLSRPILVHIGTYGKQDKTSLKDALQPGGEDAPQAIETLSPLDHAVILTRQENIPIEFRWEGHQLNQDQGLYRWYLFNEDGKVIDSAETMRPWISKILKTGRYLWSVERKWIGKNGRVRHFPSERQSLVIEKKEESHKKLVERLMTSSTDLTLIVDPN